MDTTPLAIEIWARQDASVMSSALLPPKPGMKDEPWDRLYALAIDCPSNLATWDELFSVLERSYVLADALEKNTVSVQAAVVEVFTFLLGLYPYLASYWQRYLKLQRKMGGERKYRECIETAVATCPQSVALWTDYVRLLMADHGSGNGAGNDKDVSETRETGAVDVREVEKKSGRVNAESPGGVETGKQAIEDIDESGKKGGGENIERGEREVSTSQSTDQSKTSAESIEHTRLEFKRGAAEVGRNFNSETFWEAYIEFETKIAKDSSQLLGLLLELVTIPLYLYALFYNQFLELAKGCPIEAVIRDHEYLNGLVQAYGKSLVAELSAEELQLILDTFTYDIFTKTQKKVTDAWQYEAQILVHEYLPVPSTALEAQCKQYVSYLDHEISVLEACESMAEREQQQKQVVCIFKRALVPHCHEPDLWQRYVAFLQTIQVPDEEVQKAYEQAIFRFVPIINFAIRDSYVEFLVGRQKFDQATALLLRALKLALGTSKKQIYAKAVYIHAMKALMKVWTENSVRLSVEAALEGVLIGYFDRVDRYKKEHTRNAQKQSGYTLDASDVAALSKVINNDGICIVAVALLGMLPAERVRKFYNRYHKESAFSSSIQFWNFFVYFEGYVTRNLHNLKHILDYIKESSALPKRAVDAFAEIQYEFTCGNLTQAMSFPDSAGLLAPLINVHIDTSDNLHVNAAARKRLATNSTSVPNGKEKAFVLNLKKHLGHPGVLADCVPEITNSWMDKGWVSLRDDELRAPSLPTFRHVDKATAPLVHQDS